VGSLEDVDLAVVRGLQSRFLITLKM
jgi:hypothetical protein